MNIKFITIDYTIRGGIERVISNMANYLCENHSIEIISINKSRQDISYPTNSNVKISFLRKGNYDNSRLSDKITSNFMILKQLGKLRFNSQDIIISTTTNISIYLAILKKRIGNPKIIAAEHGHFNALSIFTKLLRRSVFNRLNSVVALTKEDSQNYKFFKHHVDVIPNSLSFFPDNCNVGKYKRVIAAGRFVKEKQYHLLIGIYNKLALKYPSWEFILYGNGENENFLKSLVNDACTNISILPTTPNLQEELLKSSIFCCTSLTEAFPMVMLESMACGLAIISFNCPVGPRAIISNYKDGVLIPLNDTDKFTSELDAIISNDDFRYSLGQNAREKAKQYLPERIFAKWKILLSSL